MTLTLHRYTSAAAFLAAAEPFLLQNEVENSVIIGIARGIAAGQPGLAMEPYFATVRDADGICVAAFQTLPTKLGVTRARERDALRVLAADVQAVAPTLKAVVGPEPTVAQLAEAIATLRGTTSGPRMRQRLYQLREVAHINRPAPGRMRAATQDDAALLAAWVEGFLADIGDRGDAHATAAERIANGSLFVWDDGAARSMAAWTGKTPTGVRVNFVYTPSGLRGRGFATTLVAALSQYLLDRGNDYCCLYTDLANPTSNSIYQTIGYRPVTDAGVYDITT